MERLLQFETRIDGTRAIELMLVEHKSWAAKGVVRLRVETDTAFLSNLHVSPRHRRKGVAGRLVKECALLAQKRKCETLSLIVKKQNKTARKAYRKMGFRCVYNFEDGHSIFSIRI